MQCDAEGGCAQINAWIMSAALAAGVLSNTRALTKDSAGLAGGRLGSLFLGRSGLGPQLLLMLLLFLFDKWWTGRGSATGGLRCEGGGLGVRQGEELGQRRSCAPAQLDTNRPMDS